VLVGVAYQCVSMVSEATRLTLVQLLLQRKGFKLNPVTTMYYVSPVCLAALLVPMVTLEAKQVRTCVLTHTWRLEHVLDPKCEEGIRESRRSSNGGHVCVRVGWGWAPRAWWGGGHGMTPVCTCAEVDGHGWSGAPFHTQPVCIDSSVVMRYTSYAADTAPEALQTQQTD
jgi:hypothetical protein